MEGGLNECKSMMGHGKQVDRQPYLPWCGCVTVTATDLRIYGFTPLPPPPAGRPADAHPRIKTLPVERNSVNTIKCTSSSEMSSALCEGIKTEIDRVFCNGIFVDNKLHLSDRVELLTELSYHTDHACDRVP